MVQPPLTWLPVKMVKVSPTHSLYNSDWLYCRVVVVMSTDWRGGVKTIGSAKAKATGLREYCIIHQCSAEVHS